MIGSHWIYWWSNELKKLGLGGVLCGLWSEGFRVSVDFYFFWQIAVIVLSCFIYVICCALLSASSDRNLKFSRGVVLHPLEKGYDESLVSCEIEV